MKRTPITSTAIPDENDRPSVVSAIAVINTSLASLRLKIESAKADYASLDSVAPDDREIEARVSGIIQCLADEARAILPLELAASNDGSFTAHAAAGILTRVGSAQFSYAPDGTGQYFAARLSGFHMAALFQPEVMAGLMTEAAKTDIKASGAKQATAAHVGNEKARLTKEIESLSAQEEQWLRHAGAVGLSYDRREDADPAAVLATDDALEAMIIH